MNRWSFKKRFGRISYADFLMMGRQFIDTIKAYNQNEIEITATFYEGLPHSLTTVVDGLNEWVAEENKKLVSVEMQSIDRFPLTTQKMFDAAVNVQVAVHSTLKGDLTFGHMECKGLLPSHVVFYIQSGDGVVAQKIEEAYLEKCRPSRLMFGLSDGFKCCHTLSLS